MNSEAANIYLNFAPIFDQTLRGGNPAPANSKPASHWFALAQARPEPAVGPKGKVGYLGVGSQGNIIVVWSGVTPVMMPVGGDFHHKKGTKQDTKDLEEELIKKPERKGKPRQSKDDGRSKSRSSKKEPEKAQRNWFVRAFFRDDEVNKTLLSDSDYESNVPDEESDEEEESQEGESLESNLQPQWGADDRLAASSMKTMSKEEREWVQANCNPTARPVEILERVHEYRRGKHEAKLDALLESM